jgi:hypothetical protein
MEKKSSSIEVEGIPVDLLFSEDLVKRETLCGMLRRRVWVLANDKFPEW